MKDLYIRFCEEYWPTLAVKKGLDPESEPPYHEFISWFSGLADQQHEIVTDGAYE